ncbi:NAD(P)/FAD-dependent oxidoreductase [Dyadobacter sp. CY326]|uniref:FAD-dependent oxidoreductase n=1 Tax=Dyadobacter sp. CY326 TaxID=2907300 RepID=UPI001F27B81D|nr:NAD(P)/FAD-dependent oxidoreductase [Dyadobacter sp. CY326]MCE7064898.1 FAD-dependent monooxygenase [Dyadobacter sp. CY326]
MLIQDKQIAVVGGGPAGLTLTRLLQLQGANVKVYERDIDKNARVQGAPLDMHEGSGLSALRAAHLLEEFKKHFRPGADRKTIVNARAEVFYSDHETATRADFGNEHFRPEIDRGQLRKIFLESLQPETVIWDSQFVSMQAQNEGWLLHFKNGSSAYADIVIAADGARSKIRSYITDVKPFYTGITMLEGNVQYAEKAVPEICKLLNSGALLAFGKGRNLLMGLKGDGNLTFYASFKTDESWAVTNGLDYADNLEVLGWFRKAYPEWSSIWFKLFENAMTAFIPRPLYCMPPDQSWKAQSNLTMLGDAAHVMPPSAGEGANMAMVDALELSQCLCSAHFLDIQSAIAAYERQMQERAAEAAKISLQNGEWMHSEDALERMVRLLQPS